MGELVKKTKEGVDLLAGLEELKAKMKESVATYDSLFIEFNALKGEKKSDDDEQKEFAKKLADQKKSSADNLKDEKKKFDDVKKQFDTLKKDKDAASDKLDDLK